MNLPRPVQHLHQVARKYPGAWKQFDIFRQDRESLGNWPEWCYCPLAGAYAIASNGSSTLVDKNYPVAILGALSAWRPTQGIYRFDHEIYQELISTPITGDLPCELLKHLPEWCVYIETPNIKPPVGIADITGRIYGFFAHLEFDANNKREELRLLFDGENLLFPGILHLGKWSITDAIVNAGKTAALHGRENGLILPFPSSSEIQALADSYAPFLSLLLYLCQAYPEYSTPEKPAYPKPKKTKNGLRLFPPDRPTTWTVGVRTGAALRKAKELQNTAPGDGTHAPPRPHVRRAHWHTYKTGTGRTESTVKWLPPIPVGMELGDETPAVIHSVK